MTKLEDVAVEEIGDIRETSGKNDKLSLNLAGIGWASYFGNREELENLATRLEGTERIEEGEYSKKGQWINIHWLVVDGKQYGKKDKAKVSDRGVAQAAADAPQEPYADVTVSMGRTINTGNFNSEKISYGVTIHGVAIDRIEDVQKAEKARVQLWLDHEEAQSK